MQKQLEHSRESDASMNGVREGMVRIDKEIDML
jgi:hypothetical protein